MRRATRSAAATVLAGAKRAVPAGAMLAMSLLAGGLLAGPGQAAQAAQDRPANLAGPGYYGHETFTIVTVRIGEVRPAATASGAFRAKGRFDRRHGTFDFPKGRIIVSRQVTETTRSGPDLATCRFSIKQSGTFEVVKGTGRYRSLRETGTFRTTLRGRFNHTGPDRCGPKLRYYHVVTYETGTAR